MFAGPNRSQWVQRVLGSPATQVAAAKHSSLDMAKRFRTSCTDRMTSVDRLVSEFDLCTATSMDRKSSFRGETSHVTFSSAAPRLTSML